MSDELKQPLELRFLPSEDEKLNSPQVQRSIKEVAELAKQNEIAATHSYMTFDAVDAAGFATGCLTITTASLNALGIIAAAWIASGSKRKIRIKVSGNQVETNTIEEAERALKAMVLYKQDSTLQNINLLASRK